MQTASANPFVVYQTRVGAVRFPLCVSFVVTVPVHVLRAKLTALLSLTLALRSSYVMTGLLVHRLNSGIQAHLQNSLQE